LEHIIQRLIKRTRKFAKTSTPIENLLENVTSSQISPKNTNADRIAPQNTKAGKILLENNQSDLFEKRQCWSDLNNN
jgi:hypothetical protein